MAAQIQQGSSDWAAAEDVGPYFSVLYLSPSLCSLVCVCVWKRAPCCRAGRCVPVELGCGVGVCWGGSYPARQSRGGVAGVVGCPWKVVRDSGEAVGLEGRGGRVVGGWGGGVVPAGKVSDQGSRFGLVASVPLHVCQLRAQGAAEEAAVAEGPALPVEDMLWATGGSWCGCLFAGGRHTPLAVRRRSW